jgi:ferredoxin
MVEGTEMSTEGDPTDGMVDRDACMGSGNCVFWAPGVFDLDEDGIAIVVGDPAGRDEELRTAAANCPTSAIRVGLHSPS